VIVLSLFDGCSCAQVALEHLNIKVDKYYASEIDKYAIQITQKNYPNTIQLGNIEEWESWEIEQPDLIIGGSPCQGFSFSGKQLNFDDPRSKLFFVFSKIVEHYSPKYFLLENVKMKKIYEDVITEYLGVNPVEINSSLVSAQNRKRLYWCNWKIDQPKDKQIYLDEIILEGIIPVCIHNIYGGFKEKAVRVFEDKSPTIRTAAGGGHIPYFVKDNLLYSWDYANLVNNQHKNIRKIVANFFKGTPYKVFKDWDCIRKFHPIECERLQTIPDGYTEGVSDTQRYRMIGNAFTIDVITHILRYIKDD